MARITLFLSLLLIISFGMIFYEFDSDNTKIEHKDYETLTFEDSVMHQIDSTQVSAIVKSQKAIQYSSGKNIMLDAAFYTKEENSNLNTYIRAKLILNLNDTIKFKDDVHFIRDDNLTFSTSELIYNKKDKIIYNNVLFVAKQNSNIFRGKNIYLNQKTESIKADQVEFLYAN